MPTINKKNIIATIARVNKKIIIAGVLVLIIAFVFIFFTVERSTTEEKYQKAYTSLYGDTPNVKKILSHLQHLEEKNHKNGLALLGKIYFQGKLQPKDIKRALEYYQEAAKQGHVEAQYQLGMAYYHGKHYSRDYQKSLEFLIEAAQKGHMHAQRWVGFIHLHGKGVPEDKIVAYGWLAVSAKLYHSAKLGLNMLKETLNPEELKQAEALEKQYLAEYYLPENAMRYRDEWFQ